MLSKKRFFLKKVLCKQNHMKYIFLIKTKAKETIYEKRLPRKVKRNKYR